MHFIWDLILGGIAGWLAGKVMKGDGYGIIMDVILGLVGGLVGGWIAGLIGIHIGGWIGYLIIAFLGAVLLVWISRLIKGKE